ncbi:MAG: hypothetical protein COA96_11110 [SAR86 cluster bacterium]|uniref:HTH araC/xylS-type domain-containing protein n=1 Tax=SAR86 cluster bacterium TaxID=2030880 RepID=A0A2A5AWT7_9GAMM|nr:MAG: hypothetical protein COA96_11110 [SAR86 cluster bacterium]
MNSLLQAGNLISITLLIAMGIQILFQRSTLARLFGVLFLLFSIYLSLAIIDYQAIHPILSFVAARLSSLIPGVIWLLAFHLFRDNQEGKQDAVPLYIWFLIAGYVGCRSLGVALFFLNIVSNSVSFYAIFILAPQLIMIGLATHAIYIGVAGFRADLVENRRKFRVVFVITASLFIVLTRIKTWIIYNGILQGLSSDSISIPVLDQLIVVYALVFSFTFFLTSFRTSETLSGLLSKITPRVSIADFNRKRISEGDKLLVQNIKQKMEQNRQYNEPGLTVVKFAKELGIHPHKLRRVISTYFNFSNFNQFLNFYRIQEAAQNLSAASGPISTIAYDVGFSSISAFNAAFKAIHGVTPTNYRIQKTSTDQTYKHK